MTRSCQINKYIFFLFYLSLRLIFFSLSLLLFVAITALSLSEQCCYISDFVFVLFFKINIASLAIQIRGKKYYDSNLNIEGLMDIRKIGFFSSFQRNISFMAIINNYNNL